MKSARKRNTQRTLIMLLRWAFGVCALLAPAIIAVIYPSQIQVANIDVPRAAAWAVSLLGIAGLFIQAGLELKGRVLGVLIDERNKYSLARLQMTLWSVLVLASLYVSYIVNLTRTDANGEALNVDINWNLIVLMGISVASFLTAPLALSRKTGNMADSAETVNASRELADNQSLAATPSARGTVVTKRSPKDARIADLIRGEEVGNATVVDISRTQMLIITVAVVLAYGFDVWKKIAFGDATLTALPEIHPTLLGLIFVSHSSYIGGKMIPTAKGAAAGTATTQNLARSLQVSQRATDLVRDIQAKLPVVTGSQTKPLEDALTLARSAAAQAAAMPTRIAEAGFDVNELSALEGRVDALFATTNSISGAVPSIDITSAPAESKVIEVQKKLRDLGHLDVRISGIPDSMTEQAIRTALASLGVTRNDLHPQPYKFYEEAARLL